jgi:hypothetical protein
MKPAETFLRRGEIREMMEDGGVNPTEIYFKHMGKYYNLQISECIKS